MKRMVLTLMAAALVCSSAFAQEKKDEQRPEPKFDKAEMVKHRTDETVKRYNLNDKQAKQLLELNNKYADKMGPRPPHHGPKGGPGRPPKDKDDAKCQCPEPPKDGKRPEAPKDGKRPTPPQDGKHPTPPQDGKHQEHHKQMEETMKAYDAELQKIMTPEQYKQYQADMEKRRQHGPRHPER